MGMGGNGNGNGFMGMGGNGNRNSPSRTPLLQTHGHTDRLLIPSRADVFAFFPRGGAHVVANNASGRPLVTSQISRRATGHVTTTMAS